MDPSSPEMQALAQVAAVAFGAVLLADLALLWMVILGWMRGRPLLARRWSAAHVLIAFQVWMLLTVAFMLFAGIAAAMLTPGGGMRAFSDPHSIGPVVLVSLAAQNLAMVLVVLFMVLIIYDQHLVATGLSLRNWGPRATLGLLVAGIVLPLNTYLEHLSLLALRHGDLPTRVQIAYDAQFSKILSLFQGRMGLALGILLVGIVAPFGEEVFFRGFAYRCFRARWGPAVGMIASSALFSLVHLNPVGLLPIFCIGCVLAYLYERTGTLVAPFTLHAVNNIMAMLAAHFVRGR